MWHQWFQSANDQTFKPHIQYFKDLDLCFFGCDLFRSLGFSEDTMTLENIPLFTQGPLSG